MQNIPRLVSLIALAFMIGGLADWLVRGGSIVVPGDPILSPFALRHASEAPIGLGAMSVGIILLTFCPAIRVLLALKLYIHQRATVDILAALLVLLELLLGMHLGG